MISCELASAISTIKCEKSEKARAYKFPDKEPSETAPITIGGVVYASTAHYTVALDGFDCHAIRAHKWNPRGPEPFNSNRSVALADDFRRDISLRGYGCAQRKAIGKIIDRYR